MPSSSASTYRFLILLAVLTAAACGGSRPPSPRSVVAATAESLTEFDRRFTTWFEHEAALAEALPADRLALRTEELATALERYELVSATAFAAVLSARVAVNRGAGVPEDLVAAIDAIVRLFEELGVGE